MPARTRTAGRHAAAGGRRGHTEERLAALERLLDTQREELSAQRELAQQQQEQLAAQQGEIERLRAERDASAAPAPSSPLILPAKFRGRGSAAEDAAPERAPGRRASRRGLLKLGGVAAAAGLAAGAGEMLRPGAARAAGRRAAGATLFETANGGGNTAIEGQGSSGAIGVVGGTDTYVGVWGGATGVGTGVFGRSDGAGGTAVLAQASGGTQANPSVGVLADTTNGFNPSYGHAVVGNANHGDGGHFSAGPGFSGVWGEVDGAIGVGVHGYATGGAYAVFAEAYGGGADLYAGGSGRIRQVFQSFVGAPTSGTWFHGEQIRDQFGNLWICVQDGTPGIWRKVAALYAGYAGGALNLLPVPIRLLDTRAGATLGNLRPNAPVAYHGTINVPAAGVTYQSQTIPAEAIAVFGLLTAALAPGVNCGDGSSAIAYATGATRPGAVSVIFNPQDLRGAYTANFTVVQTGSGGDISIYNQPINAGVAVDYLFDCFGFVV